MQDALDIHHTVAAPPQKLRNLLQVGNRIQTLWTLLNSVAAVEIAADRCVLCIARDLTDVVKLRRVVRVV